MQGSDNWDNEAIRAKNALNVQNAKKVQVRSHQRSTGPVIKRFYDTTESCYENATTHDEKSTADARAEPNATTKWGTTKNDPTSNVGTYDHPVTVKITLDHPKAQNIARRS